MGLWKRVSLWTVEEVADWIQAQYPALLSMLYTAVIKHAISGRALLRMKEHHWERLGVEYEEQQEILQDVLLLRVQEELDNLNDIYTEDVFPLRRRGPTYSVFYPSINVEEREKGGGT